MVFIFRKTFRMESLRKFVFNFNLTGVYVFYIYISYSPQPLLRMLKILVLFHSTSCFVFGLISSWNTAGPLDKYNPSLVFVGESKIPTRGFTVQVGNEALPSFPLKRWIRGLGFIVYDRFFFSHTRAKTAASLEPSRKEEKQKFQKSQIILVPKYSL